MKLILFTVSILLLPIFSQAQNLSDFVRKEPLIWNGDTFNRERELLREEARAVWTQMHMPMRCRPAAYEISETLYHYDDDLIKHRDEAARTKVLKVLDILKHQRGCFAQVASFYGFWSAGEGLIDIQYDLPFFIELFNRGKLLPVRKLAPIGNEEMLGAYQCKTSTIYFDPFRGPDDLKNILTHELTHLIRDKFILSDDLLRDSPHLSAIEYSIVDETLAVLSGTLTELDEDKHWHREFDLSLFHDNGSLVGSILAANKAAGPGNFVIRPSYYLADYMMTVGLQPKYEPYLRNIIALVASTYAPKSTYRVDALLSWLKHYDYGGEQFWTGDQAMFWSWAYNTKYKTMDGLLNHPSTICNEFEKEIRKGELRDYLGTKSSPYNTEKHGIEGTQPGIEGTKPGIEGTKPDLGEGSFDLSGVRLCRPPPSGL